ncbi:MAG TPA: TonB-dependent receptor [Candidatus Binatia bacterium]|nr:TonB-dependent receptor [Candidatus Binatia bacterium]
MVSAAACLAAALAARADPIPEAPPVTVTAARVSRPLGAVPASVVVLDRERIENSAAQRLDDVLRTVPGFQLFRRQSSLVAQPTTQGASLRGIGATGASRALVLVDGVPAQDPFGGWMYWGRIPLDIVERVEVVRGGGSSLWGSGAMSGVINVITRAPRADAVRVTAEGGNRETRNAAVALADAWGPIAAQIDASYYDSGGYYLVSGGERVAFDTRADSRELNLGARTDWTLSPLVSATFGARYFDERRDNGTELTYNDTENFSAQAGIEGETSRGDGFRADVFGQIQGFDSTFSSQDRAAEIELPSLDQFDVPSGSFGASARWWRKVRSGHLVLLGGDYSMAEGDTHEDFRYLDGGFTRRRKAGGREHLLGLYVQDVWRPAPRLELTAGIRVDYWRSEDGRRRERDTTSGAETIDQSFSSRDDVFASPRLGVLFDVTSSLALRASAYRGFRAPTLNELYRPFRVRNDITEANADLDMEQLTGADLGFDLRFARGTLAFTTYLNRLDDPVANVTVGDGPGDVSPCGFVPDGGVCRQRRNLGHTRTVGVEIDAGVELSRSVTLRGGYLFSDAEIVAAGPEAALEGNEVPQVAEHQATAGVDWRPSERIDVALDARYVGETFDDDLNTRRLDDYFVLNAAVAFALDRHWSLYVRAENVLGDRFEVARTADGLTTYGPAAIVLAGVRFRVGE